MYKSCTMISTNIHLRAHKILISFILLNRFSFICVQNTKPILMRLSSNIYHCPIQVAIKNQTIQFNRNKVISQKLTPTQN